MLDVLVHCYLVINEVHEYLYKLCSQTHGRAFGNQATRYMDLSSLKIVIWLCFSNYCFPYPYICIEAVHVSTTGT